VNDVEDRIVQALNAQVDLELGERRPAPPFQPPAADRRRRAPWIYPLAAAACVAALVGGSLAVSHLLADSSTGKHKPPVSGHRTTVPTVPLAGARIALPPGWKTEPQSGAPAGTAWCLVRPQDGPGTCRVSLVRVSQAPHDATGGFDVDAPAVGRGDPPQLVCGEEASPRIEQYADRTFGGRPADWRRWDAHCATTGQSLRIEQWSSSAYPAWLMSGTQVPGGPAISALMAYVARHSQLPPASRPARMMDRGFVRGVHPTASGVRVELDHVVVVRSGGSVHVANADRATVEYVVPASVWQAVKPAVGQRIKLWTDGRQVTVIVLDSP